MFWSLVHGLTLLLVDRLAGPIGKSDELSESVLQGMLDGLATKLSRLTTRHVGGCSSVRGIKRSRLGRKRPWRTDDQRQTEEVT